MGIKGSAKGVGAGTTYIPNRPARLGKEWSAGREARRCQNHSTNKTLTKGGADSPGYTANSFLYCFPMTPPPDALHHVNRKKPMWPDIQCTSRHWTLENPRLWNLCNPQTLTKADRLVLVSILSWSPTYFLRAKRIILPLPCHQLPYHLVDFCSRKLAR